MISAVFLGRERVVLDDKDLLGVGGEGRVYRSRDRAIKVFFDIGQARRDKLRAFPTALPSLVVAPLATCTDDNGDVVGYAMRALHGAMSCGRLAQRTLRERVTSAAQVLDVFRALRDAIGRLHTRGIVVGDLNDGNVALTPNPAARAFDPWLIDADSMQFGPYPCVVAHERFLDPRHYGKDFGAPAHRGVLDRASDAYALAVLLFASLVCLHPFGGAHPSYPTLLRRAEARHSVLRADVKLPRSAFRPHMLDDDTLGWFESVFEQDRREPIPDRVFEQRFVRCSCGTEHARRACPTCAISAIVTPKVASRGLVRAVTLFRATRGRVVAASLEPSGLAYVYEQDGALFREDGRLVLGPSSQENATILAAASRVVRIAGAATWVGTERRFLRVERERIVWESPVSSVHGKPAADAGPFGLVHLEGDALVRAEGGTRIGMVLGGQTEVRVGSQLGVAFYRAGAITVPFVFDVRRGALRQIELPPIGGRLVDWSAVFDDAHVLVTFAVEAGGRLEHAVHLVDASGALVATERGGPSSSAIVASLSGKCLFAGSILAATDDGLVLVRADRARKAFVPVRCFADARDLAPPDADLLVGPGGSVYVISYDEITHLSFTQSTTR